MKAKHSYNIVLFSKISNNDLATFTKHMSVMLKSGINISEAVETLADQTKSRKLSTTLQDIKKDLMNGLSLSKALAKFPKTFDQFYRSIIQVGEESGTLDKSLDYLSTKLQKEAELRKKVGEALFYPKLVITMSLIIAIGIALFVLPKMNDMFSSFGVELPLPTKILLAFSVFMKQYNLLVVFGLIFFYVLLRIFVSLPGIKSLWTRFLLILPGIGPLLIATETASLCRNLGVMLSSGLPISRAIDILPNTTQNVVFIGYINQLGRSISEGKMMGERLLGGKFNRIPDMVTKMINVGEKSGSLNEMLLYLGDNYDSESDSLAKNLSSLVEPILLLIIACVVLLIALAVILPIYQLTGTIGQQ